MRWIALLMLAFPAALGGQTIGPGRWHGVLSFPDAPVLVTLIAERHEDKLTLEIRPEGAPAYGLGSIREDRHRIRFRWALGAGSEFECALSGRDDGRFEGFCEDTIRGGDGKFLKVALAIWRDPPQEGHAFAIPVLDPAPDTGSPPPPLQAPPRPPRAGPRVCARA